jgi:hypothetical protein
LVAAGIALMSLDRSDAEAGKTLSIRSLNGEVLEADLGRPQIIDIEGPLGTTRIAIEEGTARIIESPCPHKLCIKKGRVSRVGDWVACIPNGVVLSVEGRSDYDGITP